jgi:hypothetical protein
LLAGTIDFLTNSRHPRGCLYVQGALACGEEANCAREELASRRASSERKLYQRFQRAVSEGDLPRGSDPKALAGYLAMVMHGMSVQAAGGASRQKLTRLAQIALRAWPK